MRAKIIYIFLLVLFFYSCSKTYVKQKEDFAHYSLKQNPENENTHKIIANYKAKVDSATGKVIAASTEILSKDGDESTLGNFVCDALNYSGQKEFKNLPADLIIVNRGGLRVNLPKGNIKIENIFELMPFENELILLKISGEKLLEGINIIIEKKHPFSGLHLKIQNNKLLEATINGVSIEIGKTYTIITSDYLANGGDNFIFLKDPVLKEKSNLKIRDAIINYCVFLTENKKQIVPYTDGRLQISK